MLTTLLDHIEFPATQIAALYAERWQVEIAYLHLKNTLRGARRVLRGQSETLARQEAWAFLLVHNMIATLAARAAALAGIDPEISFTAVLGLVRAHLQADTCCPHCGRRPRTRSPACSPALSPIPGSAVRKVGGAPHPGRGAVRVRTSPGMVQDSTRGPRRGGTPLEHLNPPRELVWSFPVTRFRLT